MSAGLFVPGWGAAASLYRPGLPEGWQALELPTFRQARGRLELYLDCVRDALASRPGPVTLAGHSMGGALVLLLAAEQPERVERLILVSPAGLPLTKPLRSSAVAFLDQVRRGKYSSTTLRRMIVNGAVAPRAAYVLARRVHDLDLTPTLEKLRAHGVPCTVVSCESDRLTTCAHCRGLAESLAAEYRELDGADGHIWPITQPERLERELRRSGVA